MENKTVYEWLKELPEPQRTEAVQQTKLANAEELAESLPEALAGAFDWDRSPQGFTYWELFHHHLCI